VPVFRSVARVTLLRASARRHPALVVLGLMCACVGAAFLLARSYHLGTAALVVGVLVGLPSLFVGVRSIPGDLPPSALGLPASAYGQAVAAGRDMSVSASDGIAAGVIHAEAIAAQGGMAIGRLDYHLREVASRPVSLPPRPALLAGRD
jgi:hypothetical protein